MGDRADRYQLIETEHELKKFYEDHKNADWLSFDTEFVGERRFYTTLCLIQMASPRGVFLIDPLKIEDMGPVLELLQDPHIIKITHAGENDYRIFYNQYNIVPKNVVDIQIASAFAGYRYSISFRKLAEGELDLSIGKGFTIADWEARPLKSKQLRYAAQDVVYLYDIWMSLFKKLEGKNRLDWVFEECGTLEHPAYYEQDPDKEALNNNQMKGLDEKGQIFLLRFFRWRREEAKRLNLSKEMVFPGKTMNLIVRSIGDGIEALQQNRRIPGHVIQKHRNLLEEIYNTPPSPEELRVIRQLPGEEEEDPRQDLLTDILYSFIKLKCLDEQIAPETVIPGGILKKMKLDPDYFPSILENGWRRTFLGDQILDWLRNRNRLHIALSNGKIEMKLGDLRF